MISSSDGLSLPSVRKEDIPQSWDLEAEKWRQLGVVPLFNDDGGLSDIDEEDMAEDEGGQGQSWDEQPRSGSRLSQFVNDMLGLDHVDDSESESEDEQGEGRPANNEAAEGYISSGVNVGEDEDSDVSMMEI